MSTTFFQPPLLVPDWFRVLSEKTFASCQKSQTEIASSWRDGSDKYNHMYTESPTSGFLDTIIEMT